MDEVSSGADHKFLTCVADEQRARIVWATEGRNAASLQAFFDGLSDEQKASIRAVSIDMSAGYEKAIRAPEGLPHAQVCFDPFHVVQLGGKAADQVRRENGAQEPPRPLCQRRGQVDQGPPLQPAQGHRQPDPGQLLKLAEVVITNKRMYRAFLLYGELRSSTGSPSRRPTSGSTHGLRGRLAPG